MPFQKAPKVQHVLAVPMLFQSQDGSGFEKNYIMACDCEEMRPVWEILHSGWHSTLSQYSGRYETPKILDLPRGNVVIVCGS